MKGANKTGCIVKLKGNRRRPYVLYSPCFYDNVSQKYKRSALGYYSTLEEAQKILGKYRIEKLPLVDKNYNLKRLLISLTI